MTMDSKVVSQVVDYSYLTDQLREVIIQRVVINWFSLEKQH